MISQAIGQLVNFIVFQKANWFSKNEGWGIKNENLEIITE